MRSSHFLSALVLSLLAALPAIAADVPAAKVWRVMPVGDSITEGGKTFKVYREPLAAKLKAAGVAVEFVGSKSNNWGGGPLAHEGYGGKNAEFLATVIAKSFREHPADVVLLHAGHNHSVDEKPVPKILAATEAIIKTVREINPKVVVLVAQVIPSGKLPKYAYIPELNGEIAKLAARLNAAGQPVIVVNQADGFDPAKDTVDDKVHPNAQGAEKMAARWFEVLKPILAGEKK